MSQVRHCANEAEQMALGAELSRAIDAPCIMFLQGDLGAGKTTLVRGFLRERGYIGPVRSPTYTLVEPYPLAHETVYHLDLYRLANGEELEYLGLRDMLGSGSILLIEWPEQGEGWLPQADLELHIQHEPDGRNILLRANTERGEAVVGGEPAICQ
jgi:tRNA threonylcarbamoyladenosine biosynthesis protein TsaE